MISYTRQVLTQDDLALIRRAWRVGFVCGWVIALAVVLAMCWLYRRYGVL